jgi:hypothetical protein
MYSVTFIAPSGRVFSVTGPAHLPMLLTYRALSEAGYKTRFWGKRGELIL